MNKIRIILCCIVGIFGIGYCMIFMICHEDEYVFYELKNPDQSQLQTIENALGISIPENFKIERLTAHPTFVPDMWQSVNLYYGGNSAEFLTRMQKSEVSADLGKEDYCIVLSYYDSRTNGMIPLIRANGVEHREKLIMISALQFLGVLVLMGLCVLPYKKIYTKIGGF